MAIAKKTERLILLNILPNLIEDLAIVLEKAQDKINLKNSADFNEIIDESVDHGRQRASTHGYSSQKLVEEHIVLHRVLIMFLKSENVYNQEVGILLSLALETSMAHSVDSLVILSRRCGKNL